MTKSDGQLTRITRGLSARERALLIHQALIEDRPPDPMIRATTPREQYAEFNRYAPLSNAVFHIFPLLSLSLAADVESHRMRYSALLAIAGWGIDQRRRKRATGKGPSPPEHLFPVTVPPVLEPGAEPSMDDVARMHAWEQRCSLPQSWAELLAIELVLDEVRAEFGGAEIAPPEVLAHLSWSRTELLAICEGGELFTGPIELPPADEEMVRALRAAVRRSDHMYESQP